MRNLFPRWINLNVDDGSAKHKVKDVETYQIATIQRSFSKKNQIISFQVFKWNEITFTFKPLSNISDW